MRRHGSTVLGQAMYQGGGSMAGSIGQMAPQINPTLSATICDYSCYYFRLI
jgi:hypothetical protein